MRRILFFLSLLTALFLFSCTKYQVLSTWKTTDESPRQYNKILVVGVINDTDLVLRRKMENHFVDDLKNVGYNAVSALSEFGPGGLANLEQEQTYLKLCERGIDAVITIALIDKRKEQYYVPARVKYYSSLYYYNRMWSYQKITADLMQMPSEYIESTEYRWESIFFDVNTLEPLFSIQTKSFDPVSVENQAHQYGKRIVASMLKSKLLRKHPALKNDTLNKADTVKAF